MSRPFSLDLLHDYDKHFTVMNYRSESELKHIESVDFIPMFEQQYPDHQWGEIEKGIYLMLRELFQAACSDKPPAGIGNFSLVCRKAILLFLVC